MKLTSTVMKYLIILWQSATGDIPLQQQSTVIEKGISMPPNTKNGCSSEILLLLHARFL